MSNPGLADRPTRTLIDFDAFIEENIKAKTSKEMKVFKKNTDKIMKDSDRKANGRASSGTAHEKSR
jgi:hypothetical protein